MQCCLLALHRVGPYHHSRFQAASYLIDLHVLETRPESQEYPWKFQAEAFYGLHQLSGQPTPEADAACSVLDQQLDALLDRLRPKVVISVGWADRAYQRLLIACHKRRIPVALVSDSRQRDKPRDGGKEWLKRQLLRGYSSAFVAGRESYAYLIKLGFPSDLICQPWDVVDNDLFAAVSTQHVSEPSTRPHFLCVSRFVKKKNHRGLLAAFAAYQRQGGAWGLRLIGSGPLERELRHAISQLPHPDSVTLQLFQQLSDLTASYAQASAFVLASSTDQWGLVVNEAMAAGLPCLVSIYCGCAVDLIDHGRTGWSFDPRDPQALAALMQLAERQSPLERAAMQQAARERLDGFSLRVFVEGIQLLLQYSCDNPRWSWRAALLADFLSHV
ncbi:glycosyltransferase family 4 protein [Synechococcus sp. WH 8016]|uniref:glycosyltransferase family 4 protein n=1 Tax=Synechococcus sp. WH 8016 TaxID=166318 RepID=UPI00022D9C79|nr:glycosyltransferase family 4 protein [Synechococcus sp. WH 8016]EHA62374.1 glycosyl transferase group 1 [Synechococcus sp. WH 8016]